METNFGKFITSQLNVLGISQNQFAKNVDIAGPWMSQIVNHKVTPPLERMPRWADELKLTQSERERFYELAWLRHSPKQIQEMVEKLRARVRSVEHRNTALRKQAAEFVDQAQEIAALRAENERLTALVESARRAGFPV